MKEAYYFPHDNNARNDQKVLALRGEYGVEGYALYFMILESMAEEPDGHIRRWAIAGLGVSYGVASSLLETFIKKCLDIHAFEENEVGIYSQRMLDHKKYRQTLSEQGKAGAKKRWGNSPAISPANAKEIKGKEIKKEKKKVKKEKTPKIVEEKFEVFKNVTLTRSQEESLKALYGKLYQKGLEKLSSHKGSKGVEYVSDFHTMTRGGWVFDALKEKNPTLGESILAKAPPKEEQTESDIERKQKEKAELAELETYYRSLTPEERKILDAGARFALQGAAGIMKQGTGKGWEELVTGKRRQLTRVYRDTGELPITETPPVEDDITT